ncbi:hypothetical protein Pcinc_021070 [Petrolisthes cinctipes]|uniref:Uncharacterized protein n=1 Tax=Petrolisthes cinctipes TaxID=88211 RepID=A0AAE1FGW3_PETCI|nr:hypothetical protein Pcinc_021070 [Petrolisthes cinctipes]
MFWYRVTREVYNTGHCSKTSLSPLPSWEHIIHQHISLSETMKGMQYCMAVLVVLALIFSTALGYYQARRPNQYLQVHPGAHSVHHPGAHSVHHPGHYGYGYSYEVIGPYGFPVSIEQYGYGK